MTLLRLLSLIVAVLSVVRLAHADAYADGVAAEKAGRLREAFNHYVAALPAISPGGDEDWQLRQKIVALAGKLKPAPAEPEEAVRRLARARAAVSAAKDEQGFARAADEFRQALIAAPWIADNYYNYGVVLDKARRSSEAIRALRLYVAAKPGAPDARKVQELIYEIEYRAEEAARQRQATAARPAKPDLSALSGRWRVFGSWDATNRKPHRGSKWGNSDSGYAEVQAGGNRLRVTIFLSHGYRAEYDGQSSGTQFTGTVTEYMPEDGFPKPCGRSFKTPFEAAIDAGEPSVVLIHNGTYTVDPYCRFNPGEFQGYLLLR